MRRALILLSACAALLLGGQHALAQDAVTLKVGTLAPEGSSWMKIFKRAAKEIEKGTGGAVKLKIYGGGVQGDEKILVEKMRTGQLHLAAVTSVGLAEVSSEVLVLQTPGLITDNATLDKVRPKLRKRFEASFAEKGFEILGWGDVGVVYFYSAHAIRGPKQLKQGKVWVWNADPIAREVANVAGISPVPLGVPDVLQSLNTGHVDTFYTAPLACLSLQWCSKVKYRNSRPIGVAIGAMLADKRALGAISPEHRAVVTKVIAKWTKALTRKVRKDNEKSTAILARKQGIADIEPTPEDIADWDALARKVQDALAGSVYSKDLLDEVRRIVGKR